MRIDLSGLDERPSRPSPFGPTRKVVRGSDHGRAKLSEVAVRKMIDMSHCCKGGTSVQVLAGVFGVAPSTVYAILSGDRWGHIHGRTQGASEGRTLQEEER